MLLRVSRRFAGGLMLDASYTWSKEIDNTDNVEDNQGFNAGGSARGNNDIFNSDVNRRLGYSDVPHRLVATFLYELPFGKGKAFGVGNAVVQRDRRRLAGGRQRDLADRLPDRGHRREHRRGADAPGPRRGVPLVLPENLWGWYDGRTPVTLPSGRVITPPARTYLKYNPDAFAGRVVTTPNGRIVADQFWYGNARLTYDEFRTDNRFNIDMSIRRDVRLSSSVQLEFGADAMNVLNHTQFSGAYTGDLGGTVTTANPALGLVPGMGNANSFGTRGMGTYNPRQIMLRSSLRF